jgi:glycosyltransferase involved in cell wall biosynthesis
MPDPRAIVVCPALPDAPSRTLRLLEAMERAGARPHLLTPDTGDASALRGRGWAVQQGPEQLASRLEALQAEGAAWVQFEHAESAVHPVAPWIPDVLSLHGAEPHQQRGRRRARAAANVRRRALWRAHTVICASQEDARAAARGRARVVLAPDGVDDAFFASATGPGGEQIALLGRAPERFLAEVRPELRRRRPEATLVVVGDRSEGHTGDVDDLPALLAASRAVWVGDGLPLRALEAMASARPVVSTAAGVEGIGFQRGRHGLLAEEPRELAAALERLLADPAEAQRLGAAGRALAEGHRWPRALAELERTYAEWVTASRKFGRGLPITH